MIVRGIDLEGRVEIGEGTVEAVGAHVHLAPQGQAVEVFRVELERPLQIGLSACPARSCACMRARGGPARSPDWPWSPSCDCMMREQALDGARGIAGRGSPACRRRRPPRSTSAAPSGQRLCAWHSPGLTACGRNGSTANAGIVMNSSPMRCFAGYRAWRFHSPPFRTTKIGEAAGRAYSSSQMSARSVPWKWLGDMVQPLIFLWCTMMRFHHRIGTS